MLHLEKERQLGMYMVVIGLRGIMEIKGLIIRNYMISQIKVDITDHMSSAKIHIFQIKPQINFHKKIESAIKSI